MDVYCPKCGEPWENDTFHDVAAETHSTYDSVASAFRRDGCSAVGSSCNQATLGSHRAQMSAALMDVLGSDMDGLASELADAEYLGFLD